MENKDSTTVITNKGEKINVIDSREVAEMMGRTHSDIMKMIQGSGKNLGIIPVLLKGNFHVSEYFIESSFKDASGKSNKCYLVTKLGCEMLGNKQQGEKGILFTAKYVERFNQMEVALKSNTSLAITDSYIETIKAQQEQIKDLASMVTSISDDVRRIEECVGIRSKTVFDYTKYIKTSLGIKKVNDDYECVKQRIFHEFGIDRWEQLTYNDEVMSRIDEICRKYNPRKQKSLFNYFK